jgi:signal transduction histidine kinase
MHPQTEPTGRRQLTLKTKLLLMMLWLLLLSISSLFLLHLYSQQQLLSQVREYTEQLSTAIEIAQEQPAAEGDPQVVLNNPKSVLDAYMEKLRQLGVKDVSIADASDEVQASTNPKNVGRRLDRKRKSGPKEYVIKGVLGEETGPPGSQRTSTLTVPIVVGDRRVGVVLITRFLDDFWQQSRSAFLSRLWATLAVFALGILFSLYLSWSLSRPLHVLTEASAKVAAGDLSVQVPPGGGQEIASLSRTFNEMVARLRENQRLQEQLHFAERSTAMGRLAATVAHEIRNPLNFINLSIDHVRERLAPAERERKDEFDRILSNMKAEISRLNRLVGDFLSFGKPVRLERRPCAVDDAIREVAALVDHKARDQGVALVVESQEKLPQIVADAELLKTCFLNLMINAVDAMPSGGLLTVSLGRSPEEDAIVVDVSDTGKGMPPEDVRSAFEPYFSTKDTGLGLGLALTKKIVADHGGTISLDSAPGRGTTARIVLPLSSQPSVAAEAVASGRSLPALRGLSNAQSTVVPGDPS